MIKEKLKKSMSNANAKFFNKKNSKKALLYKTKKQTFERKSFKYIVYINYNIKGYIENYKNFWKNINVDLYIFS